MTAPGTQTSTVPRMPAVVVPLGREPVSRAEVAISLVLGLLSLAWLTVEIGDLDRNRELLTGAVGEDFFVLRDAAASWLSGGPFYHPAQLEGPYAWPGPWVLYPPPVLVLLVPFVWLPPALWWAVPIGVIAWVVAGHRPRPLAVAVIVFCLANPSVHAVVLWGNPTMWVAAAVALGTRFGWPSTLVLLKPSLLPFAVVGIRHRSWWLAMAGLGLVSLALLPMWPDYLAVVANARPDGDGGVFYSLPHVPGMLIPLAAWAGRRAGPPKTN